jgi:hypothetical protein
MDYREDLEKLLLDGLPRAEREHVLQVIHDVTTEKLRRKRAAGPLHGGGDKSKRSMQGA